MQSNRERLGKRSLLQADSGREDMALRSLCDQNLPKGTLHMRHSHRASIE
jgi:hypothetical protein